ncbi:MAG: DUF87 domain-containing protein [Maricaulaceae bacterium]
MSTNTNNVVPAQIKKKRPVEIGRVVAVESSKITISVSKSLIRNNQLTLSQIGTILKIITHESIVVAMVTSLSVESVDNEGMSDGCVATLRIMGELFTNHTTRETKFFRGVKTFPVLNSLVQQISPDELTLIFESGDSDTIEIGRLQQDTNLSAQVRVNDLLSKHFAILGSTGSGKSCTVALVTQAVLDANPMAHVVLFDPHNEYSKSFGERAHVTRYNTLNLPIWLFNFEETVELLASQIPEQAREEEEVLNDVILKAKRFYDITTKTEASRTGQRPLKVEDVEAELLRGNSTISLDSPTPYRVRDLIKVIDNEIGKLENSSNLAPYIRLKRRIEMFLSDPRYQFVFRNQARLDTIQNVLGGLFRVPVQGKPISILDLSGIPSGALNIVVSVVTRLAFELALWSQRQIPILLLCEEAHRYIPADKSLGFASTRRAISTVAKEGRKYGVSLGIISQRPSELEASTLSQCSTIFSMRLSNERDQHFVRSAVPDGAVELLNFLPSLGTAETIVFGESVNLPMRVVLNHLPSELRPHSSSAKFSEQWNKQDLSDELMNQVYENWYHRAPKNNIIEGAAKQSNRHGNYQKLTQETINSQWANGHQPQNAPIKRSATTVNSGSKLNSLIENPHRDPSQSNRRNNVQNNLEAMRNFLK